ncbi:hypothetical protein V6Z69_11205 [Cereibacter sphaeroides]|uniref:hypothetical protein n=1 Tax=Cereibacter sphaeroides TaxID=1063 RepID=UPI0039904E33
MKKKSEITSAKAASAASTVLGDPKSSAAAKTAAGSALTQRPAQKKPRQALTWNPCSNFFARTGRRTAAGSRMRVMSSLCNAEPADDAIPFRAS